MNISQIFWYLILLKDYIIFRIKKYIKNKFSLTTLHNRGKYYELVYHPTGGDPDEQYSIIFPKNRRPRRIVSARDQDDIDVTQRIFQTMGISKNFHGISTTPRMLGYQELKVRYRNGSQIIFDADQEIVINK